MPPFSLPLRRLATPLALALLLPLAAALADFSGASWDTEGRRSVNLAGHRVKEPTHLFVEFIDGTSFSIEDPDGHVLTGPLVPVGKKGSVAKGELDASSRADLVATMQQELVSATGEAWTAISGAGQVKAKFSKKGTRLAVKVKLVVTAVRTSSGKFYTVKEKLATVGLAE